MDPKQALAPAKGGASNLQRPPSSPNDVRALFSSKWAVDRIASVLPKHLSAERMTKLAVSVILKNPDLMRCTQQSLMQSLITCGELGLEPGGGLGYAYLVPYKSTCQTIIGYRGYVELARRSGKVTSVNARVVHDKDKFQVKFGLEERLEHEPCTDGDPGPPRFVYAVAKFKDGGHHIEVMSIAEVNKIRDRNGPKRGGPWATDYEEMCKKTVIRRAAKYWPLSAELGQALEVDDDTDVVEGQATNVDAKVKNAVAGPPLQLVDEAELVASPEDEAPTVEGEATPPHNPETGEVITPGDPTDELIGRIKAATTDEALQSVTEAVRTYEGDRRAEVAKALIERKRELRNG